MMRDEAIEKLREMLKDSPMSEVVVNSAEEWVKAVEVHEKLGKRLAAVSNAGLKDPQRRLTFLSNECFTDAPVKETP